jgi:hypothetical protein
MNQFIAVLDSSYRILIENIWFSLFCIIFVSLFFYWRWNKYLALKRSVEMVFLRVLIPRMDNQQGREVERSTQEDFKVKCGKMDQLIGSLHSIYENRVSNFFTGQDYIGLEIKAQHLKSEEGVEIEFYVVCQEKYEDMITKQITGFYSDALVERAKEYKIFKEGNQDASTKFYLAEKKYYPIRTYQQLETDPLNGLVNSLSGLDIGEGAAIQVMIRPKGSSWSRSAYEKTQKMFQGKKKSSLNPITIIGDLGSLILHGPDMGPMPGHSNETDRLTPAQEELVKQIENKLGKPTFDATIRIVTSAKSKEKASKILYSVIAGFRQYSNQNLNSLEYNKYFRMNIIRRFLYRFMDWGAHKMILSSEEIATIFHFPNAIYNPSSIIKWMKFRSAPAPAVLPQDGVLLGYNLYRGQSREVRLAENDRFRHLYIIGQTGMGKSVLQKALIKQDLKLGNGVCVVDPHGDLVEDVLEWVPRERADDVILFDPSDTDRPLGLNLLEAKTPDEKDFIALDAMNMMIGLYGNEIFGPRIQDYFRNGCLTLMDDEEEGGAITDIVRLFTDDAFQRYKVSKVKNPIVKSFWTNQMAKTGAKEKEEMIPYFAAKFGSFITNSTMRNVVGQTKSAFDFTEAMNSKKIVLAKLSKGLIGDINANLLGMIFVNKIQVAAMRRQMLPKEQRVPFFLYVDEFQNFVTDAFESILSEARKYRLGLIIAHQYIGQLVKDGKDDKIKNAVFGNVGTMLNFKIGATDAEYMAKEMGPVFSENDLISLEGFNACLKLNVDNVISRPFSLNTVKDFEAGDKEAMEAYRQLSRLKYGRDRAFVDKEIRMRIGA